MSRMALSDWKDENYPGDRPTLRTCQNWANQGLIPGAVKVGGLWFIDLEIEKQANGNKRIARILAA
ncbi:hypothetical protein [Marinobacter salarius]|uniref:Excisionase n=1 Tax=Marinobacter salarius TaxID=1420917 RepID=A0A1W6K914_9GAMM|nr:hypothetical protein [Marinobacter salarius]ARM83926.1 hypothetical protein MARSALSMR5_01848 [Marinobacter salarius]